MNSKPTMVGKKRKQINVLFTHQEYQDKKIAELGKKASEKVQAEMAQKQGANSQQINSSSITSYLAPMPQTKDVNMKKK